MLVYRARLRPESATLSPWQADMLFGHICWLINYERGEAELIDLLNQYRQGEPPVLFSDGFPSDLLPRPVMPSSTPGTDRARDAQMAAMRAAKEAQDIRWMNLDDFEKLRRGERIMPRLALKLKSSRTVLKNQINRLTGGTTAIEEDAGGGNLYSATELFYLETSGITPTPLNVSIYIKAQDEKWGEWAHEILGLLSRSGYGAKKSAGYGQFKVIGWERFEHFEAEIPQVNGFISLSNWVPASNDPVNGYYTTLIKYGKLGEALANSENPFKFPLTMVSAGSCFLADPPVREWYGRLVNNIAPADPRVVQYGYAFAVPAYFP